MQSSESEKGEAGREGLGRGRRGGGREPRLVQFRGLLPEQPASFLGRLSKGERRDVYAILGTFREVRGLIGAARLLHLYLREAPNAAARGQTTAGEFLAEKERILRDVSALRAKVNRAAESLCLILPHVPELTKEEAPHDQECLRVS